MKQVPCYLCGGSGRIHLFAQEGEDPYLSLVDGRLAAVPRYWWVCERCGFVYRSPVLDENELEKLYANYETDAFAGRDPDEYFDAIITLSPAESENQQKVDWLAGVMRLSSVASVGRGLSVLDIGCGGGTLGYSLKQSLPIQKLCGVELNAGYAQLAARRLDAEIRNEAYVAGLFKERFDLLVCTKVLEHVADPLLFLREMHEDVCRGGYLFLEVPDVSEMFKLPPDHDRFWIPHIYFFSESTLTELLARAGFEVCQARVVTTTRNRSYLQMIAARAERAESTRPPYDSATEIKRRVAENLENHDSR